MSDRASGLNLLSAMITPAVLISACGTVIFSTSTRLSRIVDRVRTLGREMELLAGTDDLRGLERREEMERQLASHARRGRLIQRSLTSLYVSLALFVAATVGIAVTGFVEGVEWVPTALGVAGTLALFNGCVLLIRETQIALGSVDAEMAFMLRSKRPGPPATPRKE